MISANGAVGTDSWKVVWGNSKEPRFGKWAGLSMPNINISGTLSTLTFIKFKLVIFCILSMCISVCVQMYKCGCKCVHVCEGTPQLLQVSPCARQPHYAEDSILPPILGLLHSFRM